MDNRVKVAVRIRPLISIESSANSQDILTTINTNNNSLDNGVIVNNNSRRNTYEFDWVFNQSSTQKQIYTEICEPLIDKLYQGVNATILCYGQTGSGKTFTMGGTIDLTNENNNGIMSLAIQSIFNKKKSYESNGCIVTLSLSYIEVYMEECYDLLTDRNKLELHEVLNGEIVLDGLTKYPIDDMINISNYLLNASKYRMTSGTAMNAHSSRSHSICTIYLNVMNTTNSSTLVSKLHLVDLAGSERAKKTLATGDVLAEGISINKSLFALGNVVSALAKKADSNTNNIDNNVFIPYRESKLTRILKDSLGGNGLTVMIACVSPAENNIDETINTFRFASRCLSIVNHLKINRIDANTSTNNSELIKQINDLTTQLDIYKYKCNSLELKLQCNQGQFSWHENENEKCDRNSSTDINTISILINSLKSILIICLENDIDIDENDLLLIYNNIINIEKNEKSIEKLNKSIDKDSDKELDKEMDINIDDDSFLPPIVSIIEKLTNLQKLYPLLNDTNKTKDETIDVIDENDDDYENKLKQGFHNNQIEVEKLIELSEKFETTISQLKQEIDQLQSDKQKLQKLQSKSLNRPNISNNNINIEDKNIQLELKKKNKLLEDKLKELKNKENDYNKILQQKQVLNKEADHLRNELLESKKRSTQLMKKMKDEGQNYLAEKLKLQHAEIQSQKREKKAISLLTGLKNDYLLREKVLKGQIEAKERENKQLKELIEKQSKVRSMKTKDPVNNPFNFVNNYVNPISAISTANLPTTNISTNVTSSQEMGKLNELKNSLISEIDRYMYQSNLQDHLQNQIDLRHATMKRLRDFKSATFCNPTDIINIENELKEINQSIKTTNQKLIELLDNNQSNNKKKPINLSNITSNNINPNNLTNSIDNTTSNLENLCSQLINEKSKINLHINKLKKQSIQLLNFSNNTDSNKENNNNNNSVNLTKYLTNNNANSKVINKKRNYQDISYNKTAINKNLNNDKKLSNGSSFSKSSITNNVNSNTTMNPTNNVINESNQTTNIVQDDDEVISYIEDDDDAIDNSNELDETFYPSDYDDYSNDDNDSEYNDNTIADNSNTIIKTKTKTNRKKSKLSNTSTNTNGSSGSNINVIDVDIINKYITDKQSKELLHYLNDNISMISDLTIKLLKQILSYYHCILSGNKQQLIDRLTLYIANTIDNKIDSNIQAGSKSIETIKDIESDIDIEELDQIDEEINKYINKETNQWVDSSMYSEDVKSDNKRKLINLSNL